MAQEELVRLAEGMVGRVRPAAGESVLWLHGYTLDSSLWGPLWDRLPGWQHIGLDLPGHGGSDPLPVGRTLPALARAIGTLALEHGVRHIVGLSFGGMVALQVAIEFPESFASLALGAPGLARGPEAPGTAARYGELARLYHQRGAGPWMQEAWMRWPPDLFKGVAAHPALWEQVAAVVRRHRWAEMGDGSLHYLVQQPQTPEEMARILAPTLVLVGSEEIPAFQETARLIQRAVPRGDCQLLEGAGHLCMLEVPERAGELLARHLGSHAS